jgi:hypothetical protein
MTLQDIAFYLTIIIFMLITIVFAIRYCKLLTIAQNEYKKAKDIIRVVIFTFKQDQERQTKTIEKLDIQVEAVDSEVECLTKQLQVIENNFKRLLVEKNSMPEIYKDTIEQSNLMKKDIERIIENQNNLRKQINILEENVQKIGNDEKIQVIKGEGQLFSKSTETEMIILQFLMTGGAKTAPEVEHKIGKTREHTARLMKKLWQEGYIERDTHQIPYVYRVTEKLKNMEIKT